jgi:hypothetical protein
MTKILLTFFIVLILASCSSFKEAGKVLKNEKISSSDEFLVKKKQPLMLPPNYEKIPEPQTAYGEEEDDGKNIKKILKVPKEKISNNKSSSVEKSILDRIRK